MKEDDIDVTRRCFLRSQNASLLGKRSQGKHIEIIELILHEKVDSKIAFPVNILKYHTINL
jgi:hypothetical protein